MKKLILASLALFLLSCVKPCPYTIRTADMGYREFMTLAQNRVKERLPEWYQEDIKVELDLENTRGYGRTTETDKGEIVIYISDLALRLSLVEDLSEIYLHEYVHAKIWRALEDEISEEWCLSAMHELHANYVVLTDGAVLGYHPVVKSGVISLYNEAYFKARGTCPREITEKFPEPATAPWAP